MTLHRDVHIRKHIETYIRINSGRDLIDLNEYTTTKNRCIKLPML